MTNDLDLRIAYRPVDIMNVFSTTGGRELMMQAARIRAQAVVNRAPWTREYWMRPELLIDTARKQAGKIMRAMHVADPETERRLAISRAVAASMMSSWRTSQGVYAFDPDIYQALLDTPITGAIPASVLKRLPEWCVYVRTPGLTMNRAPLEGVFAMVQPNLSPAEGLQPKLALVFDTAGPVERRWGQSIFVGFIPLQDAASLEEWAEGAAAMPGAETDAQTARREMACVLSLILYLCADDADLDAAGERPAPTEVRKTSTGLQAVPARSPRVWEVGVRLGGAIRRAQEEGSRYMHGEGESREAAKPHVRRAHWHGFWTGPRSDPARRRFSLRWLPPIAVNVGPVDLLPAVVRPVR